VSVFTKILTWHEYWGDGREERRRRYIRVSNYNCRAQSVGSTPPVINEVRENIEVRGLGGERERDRTAGERGQRGSASKNKKRWKKKRNEEKYVFSVVRHILWSIQSTKS